MSERLSMQRRAEFFELSLDLAIVFDPAGTILDLSPSWEATLGYSRNELLGTMIFPLLHSDDIEKTEAEVEKLVAGQPTRGFENRYRHREGRYHWITWTAQCDPRDGTVHGIGRDITDFSESFRLWREIQGGESSSRFAPPASSPASPGVPSEPASSTLQIEALNMASRTQFQLAAVVRQSTDSIVLTDNHGNITFVNPAFERVTGYTLQEVAGLNPRILQSGRHDASFYRSMWDTIRAGRTWIGHMVNKSKSGTLFEEDCSIFAVQDPQGRPMGYAAIKRDVTEKVALEQQLRQAQKMEIVGRLVGGVTHDFNNLLTVINGYSEMIQEDLEPTHPMREQVLAILRAGQKAVSLTRNLLIFSRKQPVEVRCVDLNEVVRDSARMLKRIVGEDIELALSLDDRPCLVLVDSGQITQVVLNLVVNARDAMPQGGRVTLRTEVVSGTTPATAGAPPQPTVQLMVTDTGCGMSDEVKSHLFEPFFTTKAEGKGTGLGLATAHGIVTQAGGGIAVHSELGLGSTFTVNLPCSTTSERQVEVAPQKAAMGQGQVILLVEDDEVLRALSRRMLERAGYEVLEASNEGDAVLLAEKHGARIQLILSDVVMPRMSGPALVQRLKPLLSEARVRFVSGYASHELLNEMEGGPSIPLLRKPFSQADLLEFVRRAFRDEPEPEVFPMAD